MPSESLTDHGDDEIHFKKGANWIRDNVMTLMLWIHISAIYIDILGESIKHYKRILRVSTILNLLLSSAASTVSISQYSEITAQYPVLDWILKAGFTLSTIIIALNAGYLKVYNIQEKVEKAIRLQQQWIEFGTTLSSELHLPVEHRKDALFFVIRMKDVYAGLIKQHVVANRAILKKIAYKHGVGADVLTLSDVLERSITTESLRLKDTALVAGRAHAKQTQETSHPSTHQTPQNTVIQMETPPPPSKQYVPSVTKLLQARANLRSAKPQNVLASPRQRISSYVLEPTVIRTELAPVEEADSEKDDESASVHTVSTTNSFRPTGPRVEV